MLVVDNEQPCQGRTDFFWCRPRRVQARRHPFVNAIILRNELRNDVGVNISTQTVHSYQSSAEWYFGLGDNSFAFPCPDFTNRRVRTRQKITSTGLIPIRILYSSLMGQGTVFTLQIDVLECGEDVGAISRCQYS